MNLSIEACDVLRAKLKDAQDQYHALMTGQAARVIVDQNGERVEFAVAQSGKLNMYISSLQLELQQSCAGCAGMMQVRRPASFTF